jgi:diguanylate cyclase (GGDEF)-like protein
LSWVPTQAAPVVAAGLLIIGVCVVATEQIHDQSGEANKEARAAWLAQGIEVQAGEMLQSLGIEGRSFLVSDTVQSLRPEDQTLLVRELLRPQNNGTLTGLGDLEVRVAVPQAIASQRAMDRISEASRELVVTTTSIDLVTVEARVSSTTKALDTFFANQKVADFRTAFLELVALRDLMRASAPVLISETASHTEGISSAATQIRWVSILAATVAMLYAGATSYSIRRQTRLQARTNENLQRRNEQFSALYNVVSEVTDTLSVRYVVNTTISQALTLVDASTVVLRLLHGEELAVAGSLDARGKEVDGLTAIRLGEGLLGRAAKRGKTFRIDSGAESQMSEGQLLHGAESGIAVPLIVGARVVGTLACWSDRPCAFDLEDERILEMLASQVATALVAADTTETSERRAHRDPLTGLLNRRALSEDVATVLANLDEPRAVVAMIDIDHFKRFNDDFGHKVGDVTLQKVAAVLKASIRDEDYVYRYGGEEFVAMYMNAGGPEASMLAERLRAAVEATPLTGDSLEPVGPVTVSIGLAIVPTHTSDFGAALQLADQALYASKEGGRNRVTAWSPDSSWRRAA